jgi:hypothetical protein
MRVVVRSVGVVLLVIFATVLLALMTTMTTVFTLAANTYIVKGTQFGFPVCVPYCGANSTDQQLIDLATPFVPGGIGTPTVVKYPASFWPISVGYFLAPTYNQAVAQGVTALPSPGGSPDSIQSGSVIFGYSQGAAVGSMYKRAFNQYWATHPGTPPAVTFVFVGNVLRPNGGAMTRFPFEIPILDAGGLPPSPTQTAGAAPGQITTYDIARQYDGAADFPTNPLNPFATANALAGLVFLHPTYGSVNMSQAVLQGTYGDTAYYLIPTYPLPLLIPVQMIPVVGPALADTLDPALRVLVEAGYNRTINPGVPTPANFLYFPNPVALTTNLLIAIPTGLDNGIGDVAGASVRPFGTQRPLASNGYVVGGPSLTLANQTNPNPSPTPLGGWWLSPAANPSPPLGATLAPQAPLPVVDTTPPTNLPATSVTTTPKPLAPVAALGPRLNIIRGPIGGSPTAPGVNGIASTINGVVTQATTAITGAASAAVAAVAGVAAAAAGGAPGGASTSSSNSATSSSTP